jgi:hypothetical protein
MCDVPSRVLRLDSFSMARQDMYFTMVWIVSLLEKMQHMS